jgi:Protein of unknown function (DUF2809)
MIVFNSRYFYATIFLFLVEVFIGAFVRDSFIRPFGGDVLVVILIYCLVKSFWNVPTTKTAIAVFGFACAIEGLQYLQIVDRLGLRKYPLLAIIIGTSFAWEDILAYAAGCGIILWWEAKFNKKRRITHPDRSNSHDR